MVNTRGFTSSLHEVTTRGVLARDFIFIYCLFTTRIDRCLRKIWCYGFVLGLFRVRNDCNVTNPVQILHARFNLSFKKRPLSASCGALEPENKWCFSCVALEGYLAHKKLPPSRILE